MTCIHHAAIDAKIGECSNAPTPPNWMSAIKSSRTMSAFIRTLRRWQQKQHQRRALLELSDHLRADVGLIRQAPQWEASNSFCPLSGHDQRPKAAQHPKDPRRTS
jgi:uncharacterized protein YjiS (DUF1127 family)